MTNDTTTASSLAMAESARGMLGDLKGVGHFEAKFYVERLCFAPMSMDRYIGEWLYYNFAAGSFHTKNLCSRLYSIENESYSNKKTFLSHPQGT